MPEIEEQVDVRDRILTESGDLFARYGIKSMTMDALAGELGISKRTIYERFKDKDSLLREVMSYHINRSHEEALRLIEHSDNAIEALFRIVKMTMNQMRRTSPAFFHDFKKYHQKVFKELSESFEDRDLGITRKLLATGINQEVFRSDFNIDIVNHTIHELFDLFGQESKIVEAGFHRKDMFNDILIPYFRGISTEKGQKLLEDCKTVLE